MLANLARRGRVRDQESIIIGMMPCASRGAEECEGGAERRAARTTTNHASAARGAAGPNDRKCRPGGRPLLRCGRRLREGHQTAAGWASQTGPAVQSGRVGTSHHTTVPSPPALPEQSIPRDLPPNRRSRARATRGPPSDVAPRLRTVFRNTSSRLNQRSERAGEAGTAHRTHLECSDKKIAPETSQKIRRWPEGGVRAEHPDTAPGPLVPLENHVKRPCVPTAPWRVSFFR